MKKYILIFIYVISSVYAWTQSEEDTIPYYYSDNIWERFWGYSEDFVQPFWCFDSFTSYDRGFLFGVYKYDAPAKAHTYLVKTDNNGYQLWQKKIFINDSLVGEISRKRLLPNGNILMSGLYINDQDIPTPIVCLLNPCCEVIWAKELRVADRLTFAPDAQIDNDGNIIIVLTSDSKETQPYYEDQCRLIKMTADGEVIFEKLLYKNVNPYDVFIKKITLYIDKNNNYYLFSPYYFNGLKQAEFITKLDSEAEEIWEIDTKLLADQTTPITGYYFVFQKIGDNILRLLGKNLPSSTALTKPYILDIHTEEGEVLTIEERVPFVNHDTISGHYFYPEYIAPLSQDSLLFAGLLCYSSYYSHPSNLYYGYIVFDRDMNPYSYKINIDDLLGILPKEGIAVDNEQFLISSARSFPDYETNLYQDVRLAKYNADLSYANVIDDSSWTYDSLCPHTINNDPINIEPEIYLNMEEYNTKAIAAHGVDIQIQPNPTHSPVHISLQGVERVKNIQLSIVDIQGQTLWQQAVTTSGTIDIDSKTWASGVYSCVAHDSQGRIVGKTKLVIK